MALTHAQIWSALDAVARQKGLSPSGLAKRAGLDATSFNPSKRSVPEGRARWPSTESVSKALGAVGMTFAEFAALAEQAPARSRGVPLIGLAKAGDAGLFDDAGYPTGHGWDEVDLPGPDASGVYALEISGDSMAPVYRAGDRIIVGPHTPARRGDRVVVKTTEGEVLAKELAKQTSDIVVLRSANPDYPERTLARRDVAWIAKILWVSQ